MIGSVNILRNHVSSAHLITLIMPSGGGGGKHQYGYDFVILIYNRDYFMPFEYSHLGPPIAAEMQK